jgi:hypothetical protein
VEEIDLDVDVKREGSLCKPTRSLKLTLDAPSVSDAFFPDAFFPTVIMSAFLRENKITLAIDAIRTPPGISIRRAAKMFDLPEATIRHRLNGRVSKSWSY